MYFDYAIQCIGDGHVVSLQLCVSGEFTSGSRHQSGLTEPFTSS